MSPPVIIQVLRQLLPEVLLSRTALAQKAPASPLWGMIERNFPLYDEDDAPEPLSSE